MRKVTLVYLISLFAVSGATAQDDIDAIIKGSIADAKILLEGYVGPGMRGLGSGLNQGWYNTAKPHDKFGLDLTVTTSLVYVPSGEEFYLVDNTKLSRIKLASYDGKQIPLNGSAEVPTIFGPDKAPSYTVYDETGTISGSVNGPPGLDLENTIKVANALPVPMYNFGLGLPKKIDLRVRFAPTLTFQDLKFNLLGFGIMHDVGQYLPGVKVLPIDISIFAGYTKMELEQGLNTSASGSDQKAEMSVSSGTIQALISKKLSVLTLYGGVGYNFSNSNIDVKGSYDLDDDGTAETKDPLALDFATSGVRATAGLRLKLAVFTLHADYTLGDYNALTAGFGINIR
jgi:hypothetical protein